MFATYFMFIFTDFVQDVQLKYQIGFVMIALFLAMISINILAILKTTYFTIALSLRKRMHSRAVRKAIQTRKEKASVYERERAKKLPTIVLEEPEFETFGNNQEKKSDQAFSQVKIECGRLESIESEKD